MSKATAKTGPHPDFPLPHPGVSIAVALDAMDDSKTAIAERLGISRRALYDLLDGKTAITAQMALRLERVIGGSAEFWLTRQVQYDLWKARKELEAA
ncbi:HigA family addiction module antitoxin [Hyphomicrobium sp. 802]|uniref:HigA family addiction module antitoxin n=1 Tax=Hyphomicrobium sp. 802 TaxID=1112272 RepID=UPI00045EC3E8|nr:HigA family addiction module antitoxin [Hyphomicrobium sp. 802]